MHTHMHTLIHILEHQLPCCRAIPALVSSTFVQVINMPIIRATISLQNPAYVDKSSPFMSVYIGRGRPRFPALRSRRL